MSESRTPLQRYLRERGIKQSWLAERAGMSTARLSLICNGLHADEATRRAIAEALERDEADLFDLKAAA